MIPLLAAFAALIGAGLAIILAGIEEEGEL